MHNRCSLTHGLSEVVLNKELMTHQPRTSFHSDVSTDEGGHGYDYVLDSPHRRNSERVSSADANVNVKFKFPVFVPVRPAIASALSSTLTSEFRLGGERMIRAHMELLVGRLDLELGCHTFILTACRSIWMEEEASDDTAVYKRCV
jgi:hypothetical protein